MKVKHIEFTSYLDNIKEINHSFDLGTLKIAYHGENRNSSNITKKAFEDSLESLYNVPIVTNYKKDKEDKNGNKGDLGGHDSHLEVIDNKIVSIYDTLPCGVVPESSNTWWETIIEDDGSEHEYFCVEVLLWKRQAVYTKLKQMKKIKHSMEIDLIDYEEIDDVLMVYKFVYTALCLLSDSVEPCFESSALQLYSLDKDKFKKEFTEMINELKFSTSDIKLSYSDWVKNNIGTINNSKKTINENNNNIESTNQIITTHEYSMSDNNKELQKQQKEGKGMSFNKEEFAQTFKLTAMQLYDAIREILCEKKYIETWYDETYEARVYWMQDYDSEYLYAYNCEKGFDVKIPYIMQGDNPVIDYTNEKRIKYSPVDWEDNGEDEELEFSKSFNTFKASFAKHIYDLVTSKMSKYNTSDENTDETFAKDEKSDLECSEVSEDVEDVEKAEDKNEDYAILLSNYEKLKEEFELEKNKNSELTSTYEEVKANFEQASEQLKVKEATEKQIAIDNVFMKFSKLLTEEEVKDVKSKSFEMELKTIESELFALYGAKMAKFSIETNKEVNLGIGTVFNNEEKSLEDSDIFSRKKKELKTK